MVDTIDVWREASLETLPFSPSPSQKVVAEASAAVYGSPTAGHFIPCYTLSPIEEAQINFKYLKMMYPTLLSATPATIHVWDISTGQHLRSLSTKRELDDHPMYHFTGVEISSSYVLAFDECQIRLFSRHDGHFLCHISTSTMFSPNRPWLSSFYLLDTPAAWHSRTLQLCCPWFSLPKRMLGNRCMVDSTKVWNRWCQYFFAYCSTCSCTFAMRDSPRRQIFEQQAGPRIGVES
jgi:hypothetical protein